MSSRQPPSRADVLLRFPKHFKIKGYELIDSPRSKHREDLSDEFVHPLGEGGSGVVFLSEQTLHEEIKVRRAVKFFYYRDDIAKRTEQRHAGPVASGDFIVEAQNMSALSHEHVVAVVDAGVYEDAASGAEIPYLVTEYVDGPTLRDVIDVASAPDAIRAASVREYLRSAPERTLGLLVDLAKGLTYIHGQDIAHCDVAPKNIFLDVRSDPRVKIGDLGVAKDLRRERESVLVVGTRDYAPQRVADLMSTTVPWGIFLSLHPHWDLFGLAKTGKELLAGLLEPGEQPWAVALATALQQIIEQSPRIQNAQALRERLEFLLPVQRETASVPELSFAAGRSGRKLMPLETPHLTPRMKRVIRHPSLLRLGRVRQLTMVSELFPGASHTRFEHSLGVMETVRRYIIALLNDQEGLSHLSRTGIEHALLAGLLSNIARFPFSNVVDEIHTRTTPAFDSLSRRKLIREAIEREHERHGSLRSLLTELFPGIDLPRLLGLLTGNPSTAEEDQLIWSLLNGPLDARVVDFVRRDALHVGLVKGERFDLGELLPHLTVSGQELALRHSGVTIAEEIISLRYWLFNRVYWNRPNRSYCAMVRHLLFHLAEKGPDFEDTLRRQVLEVSDREFLAILLESARTQGDPSLTSVAEMLCQIDQQIYVTAYEVSKKEASGRLERLWARPADVDTPVLERLGQKLSAVVCDLPEADCESVGPAPVILVDLPWEPRDTKLGASQTVVLPDSSTTKLGDLSGIVTGINGSFASYLQRLRVFAHPSVRWRDGRKGEKAVQEAIKSCLEKELTQLARGS